MQKVQVNSLVCSLAGDYRGDVYKSKVRLKSYRMVILRLARRLRAVLAGQRGTNYSVQDLALERGQRDSGVK